MQLARCVTVSVLCRPCGNGATYSGDWADGWLKRKGPDMLAVKRSREMSLFALEG